MRTSRCLALALVLTGLANPLSAATLDFITGKYSVTGTWTGLSGTAQAVVATAETQRVAIEGSTQSWVEMHMAGTRGSQGFASWTRFAPNLGDGHYGLFHGDGLDGSVILARGPATAATLQFTSVPLSRPDGGLERLEITGIAGANFTLVQSRSSDAGATWTEVGRLGYAAAPNNTSVTDPGLGVCGDVAHLQWSVWGGRYQMNPPAGATSTVAVRLSTCAWLETVDLGPTGTTSIGMTDSRSGQMQRLYADPSGLRFFHSGSRGPTQDTVNGSIVLLGGPDGASITTRDTWTIEAGNIVRQVQESSTDGGVTWTTAYNRVLNRLSATTTGPAGGGFGGLIPADNNTQGNGGGGGPLGPLVLLGLVALGLLRRR
jgi:MYXO-CTERM domain-containing protein